MSFPNWNPLPFIEGYISWAPKEEGVYGLFNEAGWVYIGSGRIRERLHAHLRGDNPLIDLFLPTRFVSAITGRYLSKQVEKRLIAELRPVANLRIG